MGKYRCGANGSRQYVATDSKRYIPMGLIVAVMIVAVLGVLYSTMGIAGRGLGNPYNCMKCSNLGYACKEHINFDIKKVVELKVETYTNSYDPNLGDSESVKWIYKGHKYNLECDFCLEGSTECYSCKQDRLVIGQKADEVTADEVFIGKLCNECWAIGYAECLECREQLLNGVMDRLNNKVDMQ